MSQLEIKFNNRIKKLNLIIAGIKKKLNRLSIFRLISFSLFIGSLTLIYIKNFDSKYYLFSVGIFIFFLFFFWIYNLKKNYLDRISNLKKVLENELKRLNLELDEFYDYEIKFNKYKKEFNNAKDLGLNGKRGLLNYLDVSFTIQGEENLYNSILGNIHYSEGQIKERQNLIAELDQKRNNVLKFLRIFSEREIELEQKGKLDLNFFKSQNSKNKLLPPWLIYKTFLFLIWFPMPILFLFNLPNFLGTGIIINTILFYIFKKKNEKLYKQISKISSSISPISKMNQFLIGIKFSKMNSNLVKTETKKIFGKLEKIFNRLSIQNSPLVHYLLNSLFLWDLWQLESYQKWRNKNEKTLEDISETLKILDSLLSLANFKFLNPEYEFPKISEKSKTIFANSISHPLIPKEKRISNILNSSKLGESLIITGSNMSGKTTYLRTIGINFVLANIGSVVSAKGLTGPRLEILTSIKNEDSLEDGISFFYSEVKRIGSILKTTKSNKKSIVLLDELLKGTNTRERLIACKMILSELSKTDSFIFITTHDIELAKKNSKQRLAYFQETVENNVMSFDYKIKDGIIKSTNALKILELENIGLNFKIKI